MKKTIILISGMLLCLNLVNAQQKYRYFSNHPFFENENGAWTSLSTIEIGQATESKAVLEKRTSLKMKEYKSKSYNSKGKVYNTCFFRFNDKGRIIEIERLDKNLKASYKSVIKYEKDSLISEFVSVNKKGEVRRYIYHYDEKGRFIGNEYIVDTKTKKVLKVTYNNNGKITSRIAQFGNQLKKSSEIKNYYNENGDMVKSENYFKGKLKKTYHYECRPEGQATDLKKSKSTDICKWEEASSDGSYKTYSRSTTDKKTYLNIRSFNKDSVLLEHKSFLQDSLLVYSEMHKSAFNTAKSYNKRGKLKSIYETLRDENGNLIQTKNCWFLLNGKSNIYLRENQFNKDGLLVEAKSTYKKNRPSITKYEYSFY